MTTFTGVTSSFQRPEFIIDSGEKKAHSWSEAALAMIEKGKTRCTSEDVAAFERLISVHKDSINNKEFICFSTIFHELAKAGHPTAFVDVLVKNGINFSVQEDGTHNTPLLWAIANGKNDMAKEILSRLPTSQKISLNVRSNLKDNTALHVIVGKGYTTTTFSGETVSCSNAELLALAISKGADVNAANSHGNTPLHLAYARRDIGMVKTLLANGANRNYLNNTGLRPKEMIRLSGTPDASLTKAQEVMYQTVNRNYALNEDAYKNANNLRELESL